MNTEDMDRLTPWERDMIKKGVESEKALSGYELERQQFACPENNRVFFPDLPLMKFPGVKEHLEKQKTVSPLEQAVDNGLKDLEKDPMVFHPSHYIKNGIEVSSVIMAYELDFFTGSAVKYILRSQYKNDEIQDLKKAIFNLQLKVTELEKSTVPSKT